MFYLIHKIFQKLSLTERRLLAILSVVFLISAFFVAANFYYQKTTERPVVGGIFREGAIGQPVFISPLISNNNSIDSDLIEILFSDLDDLTKKYQLSEDKKTWIITLKEKIFWSDGQPITADDVIFTVNAIQEPDGNHPLFPTWQGITVERLNDNEVRFTLKSPYAFLIDNFKELKIAPRHIFDSVPSANLRLSRYNLEPIGSGPYQFDQLVTEKNGFISQYQLIPNQLYHNTPPFIEKITFKFYASENELIKAFNKKEIDAIGGLNQQHLDNLKIGHQILTINIPRYYAIFLNPNTAAYLKDKNVRAALALALNKEKIVNKIFNDQTTIIDGPLPPTISGYDPQIFKENKYNLPKAVELLEVAGWTKNKEGVRLELSLIVPEIPFLIETANLIKVDWEKIGVKLNLVVLSPNDINNDVIRTRNYEMLLFGNILKKNPDLFSFWHSSERFYPGRNLSLYENKKVDSLLESIRQDFDNQTRNQKLSELQEIINNDYPAIFLYSPNYLYAVPQKLGGFHDYFIPAPANRFNNINQWHLKTNRVFQ